MDPLEKHTHRRRYPHPGIVWLTLILGSWALIVLLVWGATVVWERAY